MDRLGPIDYDLHQVVGVRVLDATPADARAVARQLGPIRGDLARDPDLTIRFVDRIEPRTPLRLVGLDTAAFTDDAFLVLRSKHKTKARVLIPFDRLGSGAEIVCESGLPAVPLLVPILNLCALARGVAPLHASAFRFENAGVLVTGWSKGGKTEALLAFMARGAEYVGDEWIHVDPARRRMYGFPQPLRLWDWHLAQMPAFARRITWRSRTRLGAIAALDAAGRGLAGGETSRSPALARVHALVKRQAHVDVAPERLFGRTGELTAPIDRVFLLMSGTGKDVTVETLDAKEVARRMIYSVRYELEPIVSHYWMYKFAFPSRTNSWIDNLETHLSVAIDRALADRPAHLVHHPYPFRIADLYDAMAPLIQARAVNGRAAVRGPA